mgnify:CR=1 FL=1
MCPGDAVLPADALAMDVRISAVVHSGRPMTDSKSADDGRVDVPLAGRLVPAYSHLMPSDLIDPRTRRERVLRMLPAEAEARGILMREDEIVGRVLRHDKRPGEMFVDEDFFPLGTQPGIAAGVPAGKRLFVLDSQRLPGAASLAHGDHLDLMVTIPLDLGRGNAFQTAPLLNLKKQAEVRVLVQDGVVVAPLGAATLRQFGAESKDKKAGEPLLLAIAPDEVPRLTSALAMDLDLAFVARSSHEVQPEETSLPSAAALTARTSDLDPLAGLKTIELISGGKRQSLMFLPSNNDLPATPYLPPVADPPPADHSAANSNSTQTSQQSQLAAGDR